MTTAMQVDRHMSSGRRAKKSVRLRAWLHGVEVGLDLGSCGLPYPSEQHSGYASQILGMLMFRV